VTYPKGEDVPHIDWLRDAFPAEGVQTW
jgi:hypothetical protein